MAGVKGRSGGARPNSGPKRRDSSAAWLAGAKRGPRAVEPPRAPEASIDGEKAVVSCPKGMQSEVRAVWDELSPLAIEAGTLTPVYVMAFADLCEYIVLERKLRAAPLAVAGPDHRGMMARVDSGRVRFRLVPDGKQMAAAPAQDEWAEFDGPALQLVKR